jgi:hypothetical protein
MTMENATPCRRRRAASSPGGGGEGGGPQAAGGGEGLCQWVAEECVLPLGLQRPRPGHPHRRGPHSRRLHPLLRSSHRASLDERFQEGLMKGARFIRTTYGNVMIM